MFMPGKLLEEQHPKVMEDWQQYDVGLWMIVGTFHDCGTALLYQVGQFWDASGQSVMPGLVHSYAYPGYATIGTGGVNANFWLNFRQQHLGLNPRQSAYHAYEAKVMAAKAPTVNDNLEMVVAFADRHFVLTAEKPEVDDCPISLTELKSMFNKYGPQDTNELGHKKQLGKQKKAAG
jgi:hypothetical protein